MRGAMPLHAIRAAVLFVILAFIPDSLLRGGPQLPQLPEPLHEPDRNALTPVWEIPFEDSAIPWVTSAGSSAIVSSRKGTLLACDPNGTVLWRRSLETPLSAPPVEAGDRLAALGDDGQMRFLEASTGTVAATVGPFGPRSHLSAVERGLVVADPAGMITLLDPSDGRRLWETPLDDSPSVPVTECAGMLLAGSAQGSLIALTPGTGRVMWTRAVGESITTPAGCWKRQAYVGSADNRIHAFKISPRRGNPIWSYATGGDVAGRPFTYGGRVYFFSYDTYLYALQVDNGHLAWKVRLGRRPRASSVLMGSLLVVAPLNTERLETFRLPEGTQGSAWALPAGQGRFVAAPAAAGGRIVAAAASYGEESARIIGLAPGPPAAP